MFIYQGKLNWYGFAKDELFTIIFPKGVIRENDSAYVYTQWTKNKHNLKNEFFQTIVAKEVHNLPGTTDVSFTLSGSWYKYAITTENNYGKINVHMTSESKGDAKLSLDRVWQAQGQVDPDAALRIWTGIINRSSSTGASIVREQSIFAVPEGFGEGKPVVSFWQWTKDDAGKAKTSSLKSTPMKVVESNDKVVKFTFKNYFDMKCTWDKSNGKLSVDVKNNSGTWFEIADLALSAAIVPKEHSFDSGDMTPATKGEVELRLPSPMATLPRIHDPMPFPKTLFDTLAHGAAFIEQAGYLTVQAQNKYTALHADFHKQTHLAEALQKDKENLEGQIKNLTVERNTANDTIKKLENEAVAANASYLQKVKDLEVAIAGLKDHDAVDASTITKLGEDVNRLMHQNMDLHSQLTAAKRDLNRHDAIICALHSENTVLETKKKAAEHALKRQEDKNKALQKAYDELTQKFTEAENGNNSLQSQLAKEKAAHESTTKEWNNAVNKLKNTETKLGNTKEKLETANKDRDWYMKGNENLINKGKQDHLELEGYKHKLERYEDQVGKWKSDVIRHEYDNARAKSAFKELRKIHDGN
ncbi:hypothetical protein FOPG_09878 [Fusarium oxysporum f. sp. conglutinans race 2 54008]|uniref:Uncharacterized protein n=3 Tax=Fusarium oxysporum f. sp. conglutinans TaxID=100902 RepID=A0A8H6GV19_FUSOX|nr:hypothetical protein FOXB_14552 [Fusarium oxysporum f. sp. conglutinans Fo5176]EXL75064.1 hypothetical protein FOPG_09878 [Fusarium oxysporum f. sp. conglutinans race 2 54008]KAF6524664.1 hypothetical protein HZS61_013163 [Fusarium oxysporum f. sp. conglutinans]KAG6984709.1 hypothetical protein FocnCong_v006235 [Fusarium oxysporum f. sp. conglutinans]KAI8409206.1 hypothetical protein FOFC_09040 [Fusarium oxysporum]